MPKPILFSQQEGIGILCLNRPEVLNALSQEIFNVLIGYLERIGRDESVRVLLILGSGRAFCAGTDIEEIAKKASDEVKSLALLENQAFCLLEGIPQPTVAAIQGYALGGGCELALACDFRIAANNAIFGMPEIDLGWIPAAGGTFRLSGVVGVSKAKDMIFTGRQIYATEAKQIGLVNRVVSREDLGDEAMQLSRTLAEKDPKAMRYAKQALSQTKDPNDAISFEANILSECVETPETQNRIQKFLSRKKVEEKND